RRPQPPAIRIAVGLHRFGEVGGAGFFGVADGVGDAHGADKHLAGRERPHQAHAHLPVEPQRSNRRLDQMAETAGDAVTELLGGDLLVRPFGYEFRIAFVDKARFALPKRVAASNPAANDYRIAITNLHVIVVDIVALPKPGLQLLLNVGANDLAAISGQPRIIRHRPEN